MSTDHTTPITFRVETPRLKIARLIASSLGGEPGKYLDCAQVVIAEADEIQRSRLEWRDDRIRELEGIIREVKRSLSDALSETDEVLASAHVED